MDENTENVAPPNELINEEELERIHKSLKGTIDITEKHPIDKIVYEETFEPATFKLIEVTDDIANYVLEGGEFYISGLPDDQMVLCTKNKTFNAKEVERSNSMMLTNMDSTPKDVKNQDIREFKICSILLRNIELNEASLHKPERFCEILSSREINIFDEEPVFPEKKMSLKEIYSSLPLSEQQIQLLLDCYPIFELNNAIYCLNKEGREELMQELVFLLGDCNNDKTREFDLKEADIFVTLGRRFSPQVVDSLIQWILRSFFDPVDDTFYKLNHKQIAREVSIHILRKHANNKFIDVEEMEKHFFRILPTSIPFNIDYLRGIAFLKKNPNNELTMKYFCSEELSLNDKERLEQLFKMSPSWSLEDIEPYILDFVESKDVYEFLAKRCRSGVSNGKSMFYAI